MRSFQALGGRLLALEHEVHLQIAIPAVRIQPRVQVQLPDVGWRQGKHPHGTVDAPEVVKSVAGRVRELFRDGGHFHLQVKPVGLTHARSFGDVPFHGREEVLGIAQLEPVDPAGGAGVEPVEPQHDAVAGPGLGNHEFSGHGHRLVLGDIKSLLQPLAGNFKRRPRGFA